MIFVARLGNTRNSNGIPDVVEDFVYCSVEFSVLWAQFVTYLIYLGLSVAIRVIHVAISRNLVGC